jgi:hypothetical protein
VNGQDVGLGQLDAGLAWWFRKYAHEQPPKERIAYQAAEDRAGSTSSAADSLEKARRELNRLSVDHHCMRAHIAHDVHSRAKFLFGQFAALLVDPDNG